MSYAPKVRGERQKKKAQMSSKTTTMAICIELLRNSFANPLRFAVGDSGLASNAEFMAAAPFSSGCMIGALKAARPGHERQTVNELVECELILAELTCHRTPVEHHDPVSDRVNVKDVVVNEDG